MYSESRSAQAPRAAVRSWLETLKRNPDLLLVVVLLLAIACGSRGFAKGVHIGPLYVTEMVMALSGLIALVRLGLGRSVAMLRRLPLIALAVIWLAGAVAIFRGVQDYGFSMMTDDVGLIDYSLILPLFALVVVDRRRYQTMFAALVACGFVGIVTFFITFWADQISGVADYLIPLQGQAAGLYISLAIVWIVARLVSGVPTPRWLTALVPVSLVLMALTSQRSVLLTALLALGAIVLLAPPRLMLKSAAALTVTLIAAVAVAIGAEAVLNATLGGVENRTETAVVADGLGTGGVKSSNDSSPQLSRELAISGGSGTAEGDNVTWRISYWKEIVSRVPSDPLLGVGFGRPAAFTWNGRKYDFRDGDPGTGIDEAGPHNSFVSWVWRLGVPAALALLWVLFVAARNAWRATREGASTSDRVTVITLAGMLGAGIGVSSFNESLTGPFLGLFFWVPLAMLLLWPAVQSREAEPASSLTDPELVPEASSSVAAS